ncbi:MAG: hypothetical protein WBA35_12225, partial [Litorimonas sp.]
GGDRDEALPDKAGHAADLLALSRNASALAPLEAVAARGGPAGALAKRTHEALSLRLKPRPPQAPAPNTQTSTLALPGRCTNIRAVDADAQRREMPFFEADVARPDAYGAFRPGAPYRLEAKVTDRGALRSAVAVRDGWLAGYPGGLVRYDGTTGEPTLLSDASVLSLQRRDPDRLDGGVWAVLEAQDGLIVADALALTVTAGLPGTLSALGRGEDGQLVVGSATGVMIGLSPDGSVRMECGSET